MSMSFFKKKAPIKQQSLSFGQAVKSTLQIHFQISTNFGYGFTKFFSEFKQIVLEPPEDLEGKEIIIQGKRYKNRSQAKKVVNKILWFSYRKGFNIQNEYQSDVGWECLIRVGQMALASALLNYFQYDQMSKCQPFDSITDNLITAFSDFKGQQQKYSLNIIMQVAGKIFDHKPGQWFDLTRISYCLMVTQNNFPMKGSENLQVVFFDQSINIPTIFKIELLKQCQCVKKIIVCQKCHSNINTGPHKDIMVKNRIGQFENLSSLTTSNKPKISLSQQSLGKYSSSSSFDSKNNLKIFRNRRLKRDLFLLVLTRVGDPRNVQKVNNAIFTLLDLQICLGIMTGFPGKAIFVVGRQENKLIYLNPHYVQNNNQKQTTDKQSHFCKQYLTTERTALDPSMTFCFYIQTLNQLEILSQTINNVHDRYSESLSIGVDFSKIPFKQSDYLEVEEDTPSLNSNFYEFVKI